MEIPNYLNSVECWALDESYTNNLQPWAEVLLALEFLCVDAEYTHKPPAYIKSMYSIYESACAYYNVN